MCLHVPRLLDVKSGQSQDGFHDPQVVAQGLRPHECQEFHEALSNRIGSRVRRKFQDHNPVRACRRDTEHVAEVVIEADEGPILPHGGLEYRLVRAAAKPLQVHGRGIVPRPSQEIRLTFPEVLVELELHAPVSVGTGMIRSRDTSAP